MTEELKAAIEMFRDEVLGSSTDPESIAGDVDRFAVELLMAHLTRWCREKGVDIYGAMESGQDIEADWDR